MEVCYKKEDCDETDNSACSICFNHTNNVVVPCRHTICESCMNKWYKKKQCIKCPVCRQTLHSFTEKIVHDADLIMFCGENDHYGVTLKSCPEGVIVVKVDKNDCAYNSGLKKNTKITHINGISIKSHENAVKILDSTKLNKCSVYINIVKETKSISWFNRYFSFKPR